MRAQILASQDLYLHIASGRWIIEHRALPSRPERELTAVAPCLDRTKNLEAHRYDASGDIRDDSEIARALLPVLCAKIRRLQEQLTRYGGEAITSGETNQSAALSES